MADYREIVRGLAERLDTDLIELVETVEVASLDTTDGALVCELNAELAEVAGLCRRIGRTLDALNRHTPMVT